MTLKNSSSFNGRKIKQYETFIYQNIFLQLLIIVFKVWECFNSKTNKKNLGTFLFFVEILNVAQRACIKNFFSVKKCLLVGILFC